MGTLAWQHRGAWGPGIASSCSESSSGGLSCGLSEPPPGALTGCSQGTFRGTGGGSIRAVALSLLYSNALFSPREAHLLPLMGLQPGLWASALGCLPGARLCPLSPGLHPSQSPPEALFSVSLVIQETFSKQSFPGASF